VALIWCIRRGTDKGFQNDLVACVACDCRKRKRCKPYAELALDEIVAANRQAKTHGHSVSDDFPLFEAALPPDTKS